MENQTLDYYLVKIKCIRESEDGTIKRVTEEYLLKAVNFSDAEKTIHAVVGDETRGGFDVVSIKREHLADVYDGGNYEEDYYYKCKVTYKDVNPDTGKEKDITQTFMVVSDSVKGANKDLQDYLKGMLSTYEVKSVTQTNILDFFTATVSQLDPEESLS